MVTAAGVAAVTAVAGATHRAAADISAAVVTSAVVLTTVRLGIMVVAATAATVAQVTATAIPRGTTAEATAG
ncbi:MAG TPA: hypothetical protein VII35_17450, partial [Steroidobacteraceae bacterium]